MIGLAPTGASLIARAIPDEGEEHPHRAPPCYPASGLPACFCDLKVYK
jgi:hypothetical protein